MASKKRTPQRVVAKFLRDKQPRQADTTLGLAKILSDEGGGSIVVIDSLLRRAVRGGRLFKAKNEQNDTVFTPKGAKEKTRRSDYVARRKLRAIESIDGALESDGVLA